MRCLATVFFLSQIQCLFSHSRELLNYQVFFVSLLLVFRRLTVTCVGHSGSSNWSIAMVQHVKNMHGKQNFAKYGNSMTFWEFLVQMFQGQTNRQWWWHPKVVPMMILCFQKDFFSLIDLGTIKKRNFWKTEKSYGKNFGNSVRTSFVWGKVMNLCRTTLGTLGGGMSSLTETF
jgi:hypothetical protein